MVIHYITHGFARYTLCSRFRYGMPENKEGVTTEKDNVTCKTCKRLL